jgi:ABC-type lipoprotein release transport system permease subunit
MLFLIAWRNLWRRKSRSIIILLSVALGMWAGAFIVAIYYGMGNSRLRIAIDHEVSHIQIHHPKFADDQEAIFSFSEDSLNNILKEQQLIKSYSLRSVSPGMLANASGSRGVQINGIYADKENETRGLQQFVKEGDWFNTEENNRILVSRKLAGQLNLKIKSKIVLTVLDTAENITAGAFRICGIYETQNSSQDEQNVFILKKDLDKLIGTNGRVHEAAILLKNDKDLETENNYLKSILPNLKVETWMDISPETALVINSLDTYNMIFIGIILLALSFGIVNTMLMAILERMREIGILMALGMSKLRLFGMILLETLLLTIIGAPLGILAAYFTVAWLGQSGIDLTNIMGETLKDFGYAAIIYPQLPWHSVANIIQLVIIAAVLSALLPAWKAIRLHPVEAIQS